MPQPRLPPPLVPSPSPPPLPSSPGGDSSSNIDADDDESDTGDIFAVVGSIVGFAVCCMVGTCVMLRRMGRSANQGKMKDVNAMEHDVEISAVTSSWAKADVSDHEDITLDSGRSLSFGKARIPDVSKRAVDEMPPVTEDVPQQGEPTAAAPQPVPLDLAGGSFADLADDGVRPDSKPPSEADSEALSSSKPPSQRSSVNTEGTDLSRLDDVALMERQLQKRFELQSGAANAALTAPSAPPTRPAVASAAHGLKPAERYLSCGERHRNEGIDAAIGAPRSFGQSHSGRSRTASAASSGGYGSGGGGGGGGGCGRTTSSLRGGPLSRDRAASRARAPSTSGSPPRPSPRPPSTSSAAENSGGGGGGCIVGGGCLGSAAAELRDKTATRPDPEMNLDRYSAGHSHAADITSANSARSVAAEI